MHVKVKKNILVFSLNEANTVFVVVVVEYQSIQVSTILLYLKQTTKQINK